MATKKLKLDPESGDTVPSSKPWYEKIEVVAPEVEAREEVVKPWHEDIPEQVTPPEQTPSGKKPWQE